MPSLDLFKKMHGGRTIGHERKLESDMIMNATWWNDINSRVGYFYDMYHDNYPTQFDDMSPVGDSNKTPIDIKFQQHTSQTLDKDQVSFHIQFRPGQECTVPYYDEFFAKRYGAEFPVGLYVDIEDEAGIFNRWLVVGTANANVTQFPTFEILRCDYIIQYVLEGKKWQIPGVLRSQNSYNSGLWTDRVFTSVQDQQKFALPLNRDTEKIFYNQRFIIDGAVLTEPRAWKLSKINRVNYPGVLTATLAQDYFDQNKDYIEVDDEGNVIGMYADYFTSSVLPDDDEEVHHNIYSIITYSGIKPSIKINGNYKKFTVNFYENDALVSFQNGYWKFYWKDNEKAPLNDASDLIQVKTFNDSTDVDANQIKVKFVGGNEYINKILVVEYTSEKNIVSNIDVAIESL